MISISLENVWVRLITITLFISLSSCAQINVHSHTGSLIEEEVTAIFRMNINGSSNTSLEMIPLKKGSFSERLVETVPSKQAKFFNSSDGYYIIKFPQQKRNAFYAIVAAFSGQMRDPSSRSVTYPAQQMKGMGCNSPELLAFSVEKPGVYYFGDISFFSNEGKINYSVEDNLEAAKSFLLEKVMMSESSTVERNLIKMYKQSPCVTTIYI